MNVQPFTESKTYNYTHTLKYFIIQQMRKYIIRRYN